MYNSWDTRGWSISSDSQRIRRFRDWQRGLSHPIGAWTHCQAPSSLLGPVTALLTDSDLSIRCLAASAALGRCSLREEQFDGKKWPRGRGCLDISRNQRSSIGKPAVIFVEVLQSFSCWKGQLGSQRETKMERNGPIPSCEAMEPPWRLAPWRRWWQPLEQRTPGKETRVVRRRRRGGVKMGLSLSLSVSDTPQKHGQKWWCSFWSAVKPNPKQDFLKKQRLSQLNVEPAASARDLKKGPARPQPGILCTKDADIFVLKLEHHYVGVDETVLFVG